ncbi:DUF3310 domain-containing protein [Alphaproteobacteria bacterium]|nr:DUF3310 domain-containing protein [Alphaproteobacteria bacterium]
MLDMQNGIEKEEDYVNHPKHYMQGSIECIRYLEDSLGDGFSYYLEGSIKKYLHRWRHKNAGNHSKQIEDLEKALFYLRALIEDQNA